MKYANLKKGIVGVCAATMLTGLCAGTAFAVDNETEVSVTTPDAQVAVTVPTSMTATLGADGQMSMQGSNTAFTYTDSIYGLQVKSLKVVSQPGFTVGEAAAGLAKDAFYGTIKLGAADTSVNLFDYAKTDAVDFTDPITIPTDTKSLPVSFDTLQVSSLSGTHSDTTVVPFKMVWTVSAA